MTGRRQGLLRHRKRAPRQLMKILFYLNRYPGLGGIENVTAHLCDLFTQSAGYECAVFSVTAEDGVESRIGSPKVVQHLYSGTLPLKEELDGFIASFAPDVVIFQDSYAPVEGPLLEIMKARKIRLIVCEHNTPDCHLQAYRRRVRHHSWLHPVSAAKKLAFPLMYAKMWRQARRRKLRLLRAAERYLVLSQSYVRLIRSLFCMRSEKIVALPNPVKPGIENSLPESERCGRLLFIGRVIADKGILPLLEVYGQLKAEMPELSLTVVGDGELLPEIRRQASAGGLTDVATPGYQTDTYPYFAGASMMILPSQYEGFPLTIVEAMLHGVIPVVYDTFGALRDMVTDSVDGFIVARDDTEGLREAIRSFGKMPEAAKAEMRRRAMAKAAEYLPEKILTKWQHLLKAKT